MALNVKCPNCGTTFVKGDGKLVKPEIDLDTGDCILVPKEIHNDNVKRINKENKTNTQKEEEKDMSNNTNMGNFDMDTLARMVAEKIAMGDINRNKSSHQLNHTIPAQKNYSAKSNAHVTSGKEDKNGWAKNSQFYGKEICGYAYNPYMIRRFLPAQFLGLMEKYNNNVHKGITEEYTYMYSIEYTLEEVRKLVMLQQRDQIAFDERSKVFTIIDCRNIFADYIDKVIKNIWDQIDDFVDHNRPGKEFKNGIKGYGFFSWGTVKETIINHKVVKVFNKSEDLKRVIKNLENMENFIMHTYSYKVLYETMKGMKLIKLPKETKKSRIFMDCFIKAGAYYTLKQMLMFDDTVEFKGLKGRPAVEKLRWHLNYGNEGYIFYAMLKEVMDIRTRKTSFGRRIY